MYQYGIDGTYYATLRLYNSVGCFEELVKIITVGKGYNILVPNVFTPTTGNPLKPDECAICNDYFVPLFSGFKFIQLTIYDYRGNMIFTESAEADPTDPFIPVKLEGWDGNPINQSPYYIYSVFGITTTSEIEVTKSGTFIAIRHAE